VLGPASPPRDALLASKHGGWQSLLDRSSKVCSQTMAFVGCERTSQIFVYDISDPTNVVFQSAIE